MTPAWNPPDGAFPSASLPALKDAFPALLQTHAARGCGDPTGPDGCLCTCPDHACADQAQVAVDFYTCNRCQDRHYVAHAARPEAGTASRATPCPDCWGPTSAERIAFGRALSNVPPRLWDRSTLDALTGQTRAIGIDWLRTRTRDQPFLTLVGPPGVGKTHLAIGLADALLRDGLSVYYTTTIDLLDDLRAAFKDRAAREATLFVERLPLIAGALVLDDLGAENDTDWAYERLFRIIDYRSVTDAWTILTTNQSPDRAPRDRLWSRVFGTRRARVIHLQDRDHRFV